VEFGLSPFVHWEAIVGPFGQRGKKDVAEARDPYPLERPEWPWFGKRGHLLGLDNIDNLSIYPTLLPEGA
jgi:hypothetical protein